jgi:hypothetical protein
MQVGSDLGEHLGLVAEAADKPLQGTAFDRARSFELGEDKAAFIGGASEEEEAAGRVRDHN